MACMKNLIAVVAMVAAIGLTSSEARRTIEQYCRDLDARLAASPELANDASATKEFVTKELASLKNFGARDRTNLGLAWKDVVEGANCTENSLLYVSLIAECKPEEYASMRTLLEAVKSYTNRCLRPGYLNECLGVDTTYWRYFINDDFYESYMRDYPEEAEILSITQQEEGKSCCRHERAISSIAEKLLNRFGLGNTPYHHYKERPDRVARDLGWDLFRTCKDHVSQYGPIMRELESAIKYFEGGERALVGSLKNSSRTDIFRYRLCLDLADEQHQQEVIEGVTKECSHPLA